MADPSQDAGLAATWSLQTGEAPPTKALVQPGAGLVEGVHEPDERNLVDQRLCRWW